MADLGQVTIVGLIRASDYVLVVIDGKAKRVPASVFFAPNGYQQQVGLTFNPPTPSRGDWYYCGADGTYTYFGNQAATKNDRFIWNGTTWDLIAFTNLIEAGYKGVKQPDSAAIASPENSWWIRCGTGGTFTNFSGLVCNAGDILAYNSAIGAWEKELGNTGLYILVQDLDADGNKIVDLADPVDETDALNLQSGRVLIGESIEPSAIARASAHETRRSSSYQQGESSFSTSQFFSTAAGIVAEMVTCEELPITTDRLPQMFKYSWLNGETGQRKFQLAARTNGTLSFWVDKASWLLLNSPVFYIYDGANVKLANVADLRFGYTTTVSLTGGSATVSVTDQIGDWIFVVVNYTKTYAGALYIYFQFSTATLDCEMYFQNIQDFIGEQFIPDSQIIYFNGKDNDALKYSVQDVTEYKGEILELEQNNVLLSDKELVNLFLNSGEAGFPQSLLSTLGTGGTRTVSEIANPSDSPFPVVKLPTMFNMIWSTTSTDTKFEFTKATYFSGTEITFAFWLQKSQMSTLSITRFSFYDGSWIYINIPVIVSASESGSIHGTTTIKRVAEFGDWVMFQIQFTNYTNSSFRVRFSNATDGEMNFLNVQGFDGLIDLSPYQAFFKLKYSTKSEILQNHEDRLESLESTKVVCWGDSLTSGTSGNYYPTNLQTLLGSGYTIVNRGVGGERSIDIAGRQGGIPMYIESVSIPSGTTPVVLGDGTTTGIKTMFDGSYCKPLLQDLANASINNCYVEGVECILSWTGSQYTIERVTSGTAFVTGAKAIIYTEAMRTYRKAFLSVVFMGQNGWYNPANPEQLVAQFKSMADFLTKNNIIVMTTHLSGTTQDLNDLMVAEFGAQYINLRHYYANYAIYDAVDRGYLSGGTYPTTADLAAMALEDCPPSLLSDGTHFTSVGYQLLAELVEQKMLELGY